jgi:diguanylate cyclase (GGDEF)-like protein/PAS domain S-box-containing protein
MTRNVSQLTAPTFDEPDEPSAPACEDASPHENNGAHSLGEIISIRPSTQLETTEALRESEARLRALLSSLDDLVFELDEDGVYLAIWTTNETLLVAPPSELLGRTVREALGDEVGRRVTRATGRVLETGRPELLEYSLDVPAGARWFQGRLAPIVDSASSTVCLVVRDVTDQKVAEAAREDAEKRLQHLAMYDALTDLPNRVFFRDRLDHALKRTRRRHEELVLLVLDLDQFKDINDTFGHAAGDEVLREVARRLVVATRDGDSIARLGGDEFAILCPSATEEDGLKVAGRVTDGLKEPMVIGDRTINVDISAGLAVFPRDGADAETLLQRADVAMYVAKRAHGMARRGPEG